MRRLRFYVIDLRLEEPASVAVPQYADDSGEPDAVPAVDHEGRATIPGSTIAGSLRRAVTDAEAPPEVVRALFGGHGDDLHASGLRCLGGFSIFTGPGDDERSTAIDRRRRAAQVHTLRHYRWVPKGTAFRVYLRGDDLDEDAHSALVAALVRWHPQVGGGASSGHGRSIVTGVRHAALDLSDAADLLTYLTVGGRTLADDLIDGAGVEAVQVEAPARGPDAIEFRCLVTSGGLHCGADARRPRDGEAAVRRVARRHGSYLVPGRTIRGVVRSQIEYMLRSLGLAVCPDVCRGEPHCLVCQAFGFAGRDVARRSWLRFSDAEIAGHETETETETRTHVAIDRFTGGAKLRAGGPGGALYTDEVVVAGSFPLRVERLGGPDDAWQSAQHLITLVAQDIHDGYVRFGGGTTRGYGVVSLDPPPPPDRVEAAQSALRALMEASR